MVEVVYRAVTGGNSNGKSLTRIRTEPAYDSEMAVGRYLIVDEAQALEPEDAEWLRGLLEQAGCNLVLVGALALLHLRAKLPQLARRVPRPVVIDGVTAEDVAALVQGTPLRTPRRSISSLTRKARRRTRWRSCMTPCASTRNRGSAKCRTACGARKRRSRNSGQAESAPEPDGAPVMCRGGRRSAPPGACGSEPLRSAGQTMRGADPPDLHSRTDLRKPYPLTSVTGDVLSGETYPIGYAARSPVHPSGSRAAPRRGRSACSSRRCSAR